MRPFVSGGAIAGSKNLHFGMRIVRKPDHVMNNIVIPLYILSIMVCLSFLIPPTSGERVGYIITIQLAVTFINQTVQEKGPATGDLNPPMLFMFIRYVTGLCIASLLQTVIYFFYHKQDGSSTSRPLSGKKILHRFTTRKVQSITSHSDIDDLKVNMIHFITQYIGLVRSAAKFNNKQSYLSRLLKYYFNQLLFRTLMLSQIVKYVHG